MLNVIVYGITIGVIVSAPPGPVGLLCIQRSLNKGRWHGFFTGVGAVMSDLLYAILVGIGMSFFIDFIETHSIALKVGGSIILMGFGIYIFRSNPVKTLNKAKSAANYAQDIISSFFLTMSNPLIIILYIGLFARFNFLSNELPLYIQVIGYAFIVVGALTWWFLLTLLIGKIRNKFNIRGIWIVNRILGVIIFLISLAGLILTIT
ncbi:MAG: LysE family translocator [Bacteroidales bacterium]|jgi:threonine/homoserine/homoserine lactone efflux protein|nr:LysE family translocator [Bacteroidales bacterium]